MPDSAVPPIFEDAGLLDGRHWGKVTFDKPPPSLVEDFLHSLGHSGLQTPLNGLSQLFDKSTGYNTLPYLQLIGLPEKAELGTGNWYAQQLGSGVGIALPFLAIASLQSRHAAPSYFGRAAAEASTPTLAGTGWRVLKAAGIGATYNGLFVPVDHRENFWESRLKNAGIGAFTFASMTGGHEGLKAIGASRTLPLQSVRAFLGREMVATTLSGALAGSASADATALFKHGRLATHQQRLEGAIAFSMLSGALHIGGLDPLAIQGPAKLMQKAESRAIRETAITTIESQSLRAAISGLPSAGVAAAEVELNLLRKPTESLLSRGLWGILNPGNGERVRSFAEHQKEKQLQQKQEFAPFQMKVRPSLGGILPRELLPHLRSSAAVPEVGVDDFETPHGPSRP